MIVAGKPYSENEYVRFGTSERQYISWYSLNKIKMNQDERSKKNYKCKQSIL